MLTQAANLPETKPEAKDLELNGVPLRFEIIQFLNHNTNTLLDKCI